MLKPTLTWYQDIKDRKIRNLAIKNRKATMKRTGEKDRIVPSMGSAIALGFFGKKTKEGDLFWDQIYKDAPHVKTFKDYKHLLGKFRSAQLLAEASLSS